MHFADEFVRRAAQTAPVCVGIDPDPRRLPEAIVPRNRPLRERAEAVGAFGRAVIEAVAPLVPAVKCNVAFFEPFGAEGWRVYSALLSAARDAGLLVIGDVKRGDVGHSSAMYAAAHLGGGEPSPAALADAITVSAYAGPDAVEPFLEAAERTGRGVFVLVRTSNPAAPVVQGFRGDGGVTLAEHMARLVDGWAGRGGLIGASGYSNVGAVVSTADPEEARRLRSLLPRSLLLVPGFGAQGLQAEHLEPLLDARGGGAIAAASRSVIYAWERADARGSWQDAVRDACRDFVGRIRAAVQRARRSCGRGG